MKSLSTFFWVGVEKTGQPCRNQDLCVAVVLCSIFGREKRNYGIPFPEGLVNPSKHLALRTPFFSLCPECLRYEISTQFLYTFGLQRGRDVRKFEGEKLITMTQQRPQRRLSRVISFCAGLSRFDDVLCVDITGASCASSSWSRSIGN